MVQITRITVAEDVDVAKVAVVVEVEVNLVVGTVEVVVEDGIHVNIIPIQCPDLMDLSLRRRGVISLKSGKG